MSYSRKCVKNGIITAELRDEIKYISIKIIERTM